MDLLPKKSYSQTALIRYYFNPETCYSDKIFSELLIIPIHVSVGKKLSIIRKLLIRNLALILNKLNRILNFFFKC